MAKTFRFNVVLNPSIKKRLSGAAARSVRGFTTVSPKTAAVLKNAGLTGQLRYNRKGYVTVATGRLPKSLVEKAAFKSGPLPKTVLLHRLAFVAETGKNLTKFKGKNFGNAVVIDHKNNIRDFDTIGNLRPLTNRQNTARISKKTFQLAITQGNKTVTIKSGGTFKTAGAEALQTKLATIGHTGLKKIAEAGRITRLKKYGADTFHVGGVKSAVTLRSRVGAQGVKATRIKAQATTLQRLGVKGISAFHKQGAITHAKKDPNFFAKVSQARITQLHANPKLAFKATSAARTRLKQLNSDPAFRARKSAAIKAALKKRKR
jgi:hypothetical protein